MESVCLEHMERSIFNRHNSYPIPPCSHTPFCVCPFALQVILGRLQLAISSTSYLPTYLPTYSYFTRTFYVTHLQALRCSIPISQFIAIHSGPKGGRGTGTAGGSNMRRDLGSSTALTANSSIFERIPIRYPRCTYSPKKPEKKEKKKEKKERKKKATKTTLYPIDIAAS